LNEFAVARLSPTVRDAIAVDIAPAPDV